MAQRQRTGPFILSTTVDFPDDLYNGVYTPHLLGELMRFLRSLGMRRVYWLDYGDPDPASELWSPMLSQTPYGEASLARLGDPLAAAVQAAHANGLELYAVMKPFAGATTITWPDGSPEASRGALARIGGRIRDPYAYLGHKPDLRIRRRPTATTTGHDVPTIGEIRLVKADAQPTRIGRADLQIWTSETNLAYHRADVGFVLSEQIRQAEQPVVDYFGRVVTLAGTRVRVLRLTGLELTAPFVLVTTTLRGGTPDFHNIASAMVEAIGADGGRLPIVVATRSATAHSTRDFRTDGLEFDAGYGPFAIDLDVDNGAPNATWSAPQGGCVAFALGRNESLAGAPCESEPEVQRIWLAWIERLIRAGVDGVDIRVSAHGTLTDEPAAYGFNAPVIDAYRARFGQEPQGDADLDGVAEVRGAAYTAFLRAARQALRRAGLPMQVHLHTEAFRPSPAHGALMGIPANLRFDWRAWLAEGLVDGATLRTSWYEGMGPDEEAALVELLADPIVAETIEASARAGVPLYMNRYAMAGGDIRAGDRVERYLDDLALAVRDPRLAGFDVYEVSVYLRPSADGQSIEPIGDFAGRLRDKAVSLGLA
ncbi:MAG TPA: hypothetical protein VNF73_10755 [Candidatus Saccharimonadales bacterium]|nr:hypothetical protein [Candidatus Saccharimonadales bacterium]